MPVMSITSTCGHTILPADIGAPERVMVALPAFALHAIADAMMSCPGAEFTPAQDAAWGALDAAHRALTGKALYA